MLPVRVHREHQDPRRERPTGSFRGFSFFAPLSLKARADAARAFAAAEVSATALRHQWPRGRDSWNHEPGGYLSQIRLELGNCM